jgi:hypothetical protein
VWHNPEYEADTDRPFAAVGGGGAQNVEQWLKAVAAVRPSSRLRDKMALQAAIYLIAATPAARRSEFALEIARRKRERRQSRAA